MIMFRNFINQDVTNHSKIKTLGYFGLRSSAQASKTTAKMDKRRLKITSKVLKELKAQFPETKEFIEERLKQRKYISGRGNFSFYMTRSTEEYFLFCSAKF